MTAWWDQPFLAVDTETTGVDTAHDRIVTASIVHIAPDARPRLDRWLIAVDVDIPAEAQAVHGISTEQAREQGEPADEVLDVVAADIALALVNRIPVVAFNAVFDLTIIENELRRNGLPTLSERLDSGVYPIIDARVVDKQVSHRKGSRKLTDVCAHWGVLHGGAHEASADALAAARLAVVLAQRNSQIARCSPKLLHDSQVAWCREQCESLQAYFRKQPGREHDVIDSCWPICYGHAADQAVAS